MGAETLTSEPGGNHCCGCGSSSSTTPKNSGGSENPGTTQGTTGNGTCVETKYDPTTYYTYSSDKTCCPECLAIPRRGCEMNMAWKRLGGQEALESAYKDGWMPGGAGSVFVFLPRVNTHNVPDASGRRVYSEDGTLAYDQNDTPQAELPRSAKRDTTYFTEYYAESGVYFEYWAGSSIGTSHATFGRLNRRYDSAGNVMQYHYTNNAQGRAVLRRMSGDVGNGLTPYFEYADDTIDATHFAPLTKMYVRDPETPADSRTAYFEYKSYTDVVTGFAYPFLSKIVNPTGCVRQYDPVVPFNDISDTYQLKRDVDPEGYETYFSYTAGTLTKVTEPEGRITYYEYTDVNLTKKSELGRGTHYTSYDTGSASGKMPLVTRELDPLGNATYYFYDATLARLTRKIEPNVNVTYYEYVGGGLGNKYAMSRKVSLFNGASTYFGYFPAKYDLARTVGPRQAADFSYTTYHRYDGLRNRTATVDALGRETLMGYDSLGHLSREMNARGYTAYFNYDQTKGNLDSKADQEGNTTYFGYSGFRDLVRSVSPRWPERGFAAFTSYFEYDQLSRKTKETDPLLNVTYYDWTSRGDLLARVDARRTETEYTYNGLRLQTKETVTDQAGTQLTQAKHGYDIYKNRTRTQDALGHTTYFHYDQIDRQTSMVDALLNPTYSFYDSVSNRTHLRDARGNTTYHFYDLLSRNTVVRDAQGDATYFFYDLANNRTHARDPRGNTAYFFFDQLDRVKVTQDAVGNATYFFFDEVSNQSVVRDARASSTYYFYDRANRRTSMRDALGRPTYFTYDAGGNLTKTTDARGNYATTAYDALDRQSVIGDPVGNAVRTFYDPVGNQSVLERGAYGYGIQPYGTSPYGGSPGASTYFFYDGLNRNTLVRDALANQTYFFYDVVSNRIATRNPLHHSTYFGYDAIHRMTRLRDALGKTTYFEFDSVSNRTKVLDPNLHAVQMRYDSVNRPDAIRFPDTGSAYFFYDAASNQTKQVDPRGNATYYGYDTLNRATRLADAFFQTVYFEYDPVSNLSKEIGAEGESSAFTYDALNRRTNVAYTAAGSVVSASLRSDPYYVYDEVGNLVQVGDLWGLHRLGYDAADRPVRHQFPESSVVYFEYDRRWNVSAIAYPGSAGTLRAAYDSVDRQTIAQAPSGAAAYFTYDADSKLTRRMLGNQGYLDVTYDNAERVDTWAWFNKNNTALSHFDYTRDAKGLVVQSVRESTHSVYYGYDENDRLTSEIWTTMSATPVEVYGFRYAYDVAGNRTKSRVNGTDTYYFYDQANQLKVKGTNAVYATPSYYVYDKNGSLLDMIEPGGTTKFAYNAAGLAARIRWKDASSTYFFYDGMLRRYAMIAAGASQATYFLWEGMNLLQERNADGTVKEEHTNVQTPIGGIAQLVETYRPAESASLKMIYPIMDWRGTITKWVQSDGTTVLASREYDAFGNIIPNSASGTWPGRFGYQGQAWIEIGSADVGQRLILSPTRVYAPETGLFGQRDPLTRERLSAPSYILSAPSKHYDFASVATGNVVDPTGRDIIDGGVIRVPMLSSPGHFVGGFTAARFILKSSCNPCPNKCWRLVWPGWSIFIQIQLAEYYAFWSRAHSGVYHPTGDEKEFREEEIQEHLKHEQIHADAIKAWDAYNEPRAIAMAKALGEGQCTFKTFDECNFSRKALDKIWKSAWESFSRSMLAREATFRGRLWGEEHKLPQPSPPEKQ